jgi:rubrerythrin
MQRAGKQMDAYLCQDALDTEKHVSALYDTCIFEFKGEDARSMLNQIQKQEQEHGKRIYDYMAANICTTKPRRTKDVSAKAETSFCCING